MSFKDYLQESASAYQKVIEMNKDREGQPMLNARGEEVRNTLVLGAGVFAKKKSDMVTITEFDSRGNKTEIMIDSDQLRNLSKL